MKTLEKIKLIVSIFFILTTLSCTNKNNEEFLKQNNNSNYYKIVYFQDTIYCINEDENKSTKKDTATYVHKKNEYYQNVDEPFTDFKHRLSLSTIRDTIYNYDVLGKPFFCKISKIKNDKYKTVYGNYDSLSYKYRHTILYDKNYKIFKIEIINNKEKAIFLKQ